MNGEDISSCFLSTSLRRWRTNLTGPNTGQHISESQPNLLEFFEIGRLKFPQGLRPHGSCYGTWAKTQISPISLPSTPALVTELLFASFPYVCCDWPKTWENPGDQDRKFRRQWRVSAIKVSSKTAPRWVFEHLKSCRYGDPFLARLRLVFIRWIQGVFSSLQVSYRMNFEFIVVEDIPLCFRFGTLMATPDQLGLWLRNRLKLSSHLIAVNSIFPDVLLSITWIWHPEIQAESLSSSLSFFPSVFLFSSLILSSILFSFFLSLSLSLSPSLSLSISFLSLSCQCVSA